MARKGVCDLSEDQAKAGHETGDCNGLGAFTMLYGTCIMHWMTLHTQELDAL